MELCNFIKTNNHSIKPYCLNKTKKYLVAITLIKIPAVSGLLTDDVALLDVKNLHYVNIHFIIKIIPIIKYIIQFVNNFCAKM